jgi:hypothetical protein
MSPNLIVGEVTKGPLGLILMLVKVLKKLLISRYGKHANH